MGKVFFVFFNGACLHASEDLDRSIHCVCVCLCNSMLCGNDWDLHLKEIYWCLSVDWVAVAFASFILMACVLWLGVLPVPLFDLISRSTPGISSDWTSGQQL